MSIEIVNPNPSGLRSIELDSAASTNARLRFITPSRPSDVHGKIEALVELSPIDLAKDFTGRIVIYDRTGHPTYYSYSYQRPRLETAVSAIDFGLFASPATRDTVISLINPTDDPVYVEEVELASGGNDFDGFDITSITPHNPSSRYDNRPQKGDGLDVHIRVMLYTSNWIAEDTLKVAVLCGYDTLRIPLRASMPTPCPTVNDLNFWTLDAKYVRKVMTAHICNKGRLPLTLGGNNGEDVVTWSDSSFWIPPSELAALKGMTLAPGECVALHVTFEPKVGGGHRTVAHFLTNIAGMKYIPLMKDSSIWQGTLSGVSGVDEDVRAGYRLADATPNPAVGRTLIAWTLGHPGHVTVEIRDPLGRIVATLVDEMMEAGEHRAEWNASGEAAGTYYCRISAGGWSSTRPIVLVR